MSPDRSRLHVLLAAGGTGGHVYAALAVASELVAQLDADVVFAGTPLGFEQPLVCAAGFRFETVNVRPVRGGSAIRPLTGLSFLPVALVDAARLLRRVHPDVVMGFGGHVSGPVLAAATVTGLPTLLLEPNVVPGLANRWLSPLVGSAAVAWDDTARHFGRKAVVTGTPVRSGIARIRPPAWEEARRLLVVGGRLGSRELNRAMVRALGGLSVRRQRLQITHQTGPADAQAVRRAYRDHGFDARVEPYLDVIERAYAESDVVISTAGAVTCAELAAAGRPSVLIPSPAAGRHQRHNARAMARGGAAIVLEDADVDAGLLAPVVLDLLRDRRRRRELAAAARRLARPHAAALIVDRLLALAGRPAQDTRREGVAAL